ncbi:MAG: hypothetical protein AB1817_15770 [Chloroflexota bacterium]
MSYVYFDPGHSNEQTTIQIWKSTTNWLAQSPRERQAIFNRLAEAMDTHHRNGAPAEGGPFLLQNGTISLLVWTLETDCAGLAEFASQGLNHYFEPLATVAPNKGLNAKSLATKLSFGQFHLFESC